MVSLIATYAARFILAPLASLWRWLTEEPVRMAFAVLLLLCGVLCWRLASVDGERDKWRDRSAAEALAHETTVMNYRAAAVEAERVMAANIIRVKSEQDAISERKNHELQTARATADARYRRLLETAAAASASGSGEVGLPPISDATCLAYGAARCDELPARLKAAQDNTDQLIALQGWVREQAGVVTSPVEAVEP